MLLQLRSNFSTHHDVSNNVSDLLKSRKSNFFYSSFYSSKTLKFLHSDHYRGANFFKKSKFCVTANESSNGAFRRSNSLTTGIKKINNSNSLHPHQESNKFPNLHSERQFKDEPWHFPNQNRTQRSKPTRTPFNFRALGLGKLQLEELQKLEAGGSPQTRLGLDDITAMRERFQEMKIKGLQALKLPQSQKNVKFTAAETSITPDSRSDSPNQIERSKSDPESSDQNQNPEPRTESDSAIDSAKSKFQLDPYSLIPGDFVVHKTVGVGKFMYLKNEIPKGKEKHVTYVYLEYADGTAKLSCKQASKLLYRFRASGESGYTPKLGKLKDTKVWEKRKMKGRLLIQKMVFDLMELYVHRLKEKRKVYPKIKEAMAEFSSKFPYTPTPDQLSAFDDVEHDMCEKESPMDRLICGDVGFGKTEVALRAIFHAATCGKQVIVLAPTTVLAKQHFKVISNRFSSYPQHQVALLSRFQKENEKKNIIMGINKGKIQIIVGTHALLTNNFHFPNLGLLIIDEEQRFGVKQKEQITSMKKSIDVLTLSATPIPRTLYMALNGFRDASLITTPPPERLPIQTHLEVFGLESVVQAIQTELERKGQVFYVVPRVQGVEQKIETLMSIFPNVKFDLAHGQQQPEELEYSMERFLDGDTDVLVCTTIIESGIDITTVNTIIIEDVHMFGLAQLYQLRGRVGRSNKEAHAYFFHPPKALLTSNALERLKALQEFCGLGEGFQLAERDMAIRGIGNIFGEKQSGNDIGIGVDLYMEMLHECLQQVDSQILPRVDYEDVKLELSVEYFVPSSYIPAVSVRGKVLKNLLSSAKRGMTSLLNFVDEMRESHGVEPYSVEVLLKLIFMKRIAADLGIHRISSPSQTDIIMETEMKEETFQFLLNSIQDENIKNSISFSQGEIVVSSLIKLKTEQLFESIFSLLVLLRCGIPSFVQYL